MSTFKIGQLVLTNDNKQARVLGEKQGTAVKTYRVMMIEDGSEWNLPHGDLALPGEDRAAAARERSAHSWRAPPGAPFIGDGQGNYVTTPADDETMAAAEAY